MDIEEFASHMRPTAGLDNPIADQQFIEPGIAVGMDHAAEVPSDAPADAQAGAWIELTTVIFQQGLTVPS